VTPGPVKLKVDAAARIAAPSSSTATAPPPPPMSISAVLPFAVTVTPVPVKLRRVAAVRTLTLSSSTGMAVPDAGRIGLYRRSFVLKCWRFHVDASVPGNIRNRDVGPLKIQGARTCNN